LERHSLGLDYYRGYADLLKSVTVEDILEIAQYYLNVDRLAVAIAGP